MNTCDAPTTKGAPCRIRVTSGAYCHFHHPMARRCRAIVDDGNRCGSYRVDRDWCLSHDPESVHAKMNKGRA